MFGSVAPPPSMPRHPLHPTRSLAQLSFEDIVVTLGNSSTDDGNHGALEPYTYNGVMGDHDVFTRALPNGFISSVRCRVLVTSGRRFCVHVGYGGLSPPFNNAGLQSHVFIDGVGPVDWGFVPPAGISKRIKQIYKGLEVTTGEIEMTGRKVNDGSICPFCFHVRQTTDLGDDIPPSNMGSFGQIEVRVWWATEDVLAEPISPLNWEINTDLFGDPIHEKLKKVEYSCAARLDQAEPSPGDDERDTSGTNSPLQDEPFVFCFQYRTRAIPRRTR